MDTPSIARARYAVLGICLCVLSACTGSGDRHPSVSVSADGQAGWAVLPLQNLSGTAQAGEQAAALVETRLRRRGVEPLALIGRDRPATLAALLAVSDDGPALRAQAQADGHGYALSGSVHEWHYTQAPDREAVVGLSLRLEDLGSGRVLWQASASRTGWGRASVSSVGERVIATLLDELAIQFEPTR